MVFSGIDLKTKKSKRKGWTNKEKDDIFPPINLKVKQKPHISVKSDYICTRNI